MPELPQRREARFAEQYGLPAYDAGLLTASKASAELFEAVLEVEDLAGEALRDRAKAVSNWMLGELARLLNAGGRDIADVKFQPRHVISLLDMISDGTLSNSMAKTVFEEMFNSGDPPGQIAARSGMVQISDAYVVGDAVEVAIVNNPKPVEDYLKGKETAMRYLVGQVMKVTKGKANPQLVGTLVKDRLESLR